MNSTETATLQSRFGAIIQWMRRLSLQTKILLLLLAVSLIPVIGVSIRNVSQTDAALRHAAEVSLQAGAAQTASTLDSFIQSTLDSIRVESQLVDLVDLLSMPVVTRKGSQEEDHAALLLRSLSKKDPVNIVSYALVDETGVNILDTVKENIGGSEVNDEYFKKTIETGLPYATAVVYKGSQLIIHFASPVRNTAGNIVGVLRAEYNSAVFQQILAQNAQVSGSNTSITLLDEYHIRMADSSDAALIQKSVVPLPQNLFEQAVNQGRLQPTSATEQATDNPALETALANIDKAPVFTVDLLPNQAGQDTVAAAKMSTQPWVVTFSQPESVFLRDVQAQTQTNYITVGVLTVFLLIISFFAARGIARPLLDLTKTANEIASGNYGARAIIEAQDETGDLANAFNSMAGELQETLSGLEQRVTERTLALEESSKQIEKRASQLQAISELARSIASLQDPDRLLTTITNLVSQRFGYYHVGIFLVDEQKEFAILRAANSEGGKKMLARNHRLKIGIEGIVGFAISTGKARIALDVGSDAVFFNNPDLPNTHSEIALPLTIGGDVIGALDVQSEESQAFREEDMNVLGTLADQISVALQNARLFEQSQSALKELERTFQRYTESSWQQYTSTSQVLGYRALEDKLEPILDASKARPSKKADSIIRLPIKVRGSTIGTMGIKTSKDRSELTEDEMVILQAATERVGVALESARLFREAQRRAATERAIGEVASKLSSSPDIDTILRLTVEELGNLLQDSEIAFQLSTATDSQD